MKGRTYRFMKEEPLYPFGFGLSYTSLKYDRLTLSSESVKKGDPVDLQVRITNTGVMDAEEVVQFYLSDMEASVYVPQWALKGFKRVFIRAGESKEVSFTCTPEMMQLIDEKGRAVLEKGDFRVFVGPSSPYKKSQELGLASPVTASFMVK